MQKHIWIEFSLGFKARRRANNQITKELQPDNKAFDKILQGASK
jgi:hypothetical protein